MSVRSPGLKNRLLIRSIGDNPSFPLDAKKKIAQKNIIITATEESITGITQSSTDISPITTNTDSIPITVIAIISNTLSIAIEDMPVVRGIFFFFLRIYGLIMSPIRAGRITLAD